MSPAWHVPYVFQKTLGEISRYTSYLCELGDADASLRCYQLLRGINHNIQDIYYTNVLQPSLKHIVAKEKLVAAYVTTATCVVVWAVAMMNHVQPLLSSVC